MFADEAIQGAIDDPQRLFQQDKKDFALYYKDFKRMLKLEQRELDPHPRNWHSFDGEVLRERYDDMECESHYNSEISHESFPMPQPKRRIKNPEYLARLELFR